MSKQTKSGSPAKRKSNVAPLMNSSLGRRIAALETRCMQLEGQRTMMMRALGALAVAHAKAVGDEHPEPAILIPFAEMNIERDIGLAIDKEHETPGLVVAVAKPVRPEKPIDSEAEAASMVEVEEAITEAREKDDARRSEEAALAREDRDRSTRR